MIRISIEVNSGGDRFEVSARAQSIRQALEVAGDQNPGCDVKVMFPIDPETFFAGDAGSRTAEIAA